MQISLYILLSFFFLGTVFSQETEIEKIREIYKKTEEQIKEGLAQEGGGLYSNEIIVNSNNGSWRAVGNYSKKVTFWYDDDPDMAVEIDENATKTSVLKKIVVTTSASAGMKTYTEYLFDNDKLIFCFIKDDVYEEHTEFRYYFSNDKLIRYMDGQEIKKENPDVSDILETVKYYKDLFLLTF